MENSEGQIVEPGSATDIALGALLLAAMLGAIVWIILATFDAWSATGEPWRTRSELRTDFANQMRNR